MADHPPRDLITSHIMCINKQNLCFVFSLSTLNFGFSSVELVFFSIFCSSLISFSLGFSNIEKQKLFCVCKNHFFSKNDFLDLLEILRYVLGS